MSESDRYLLDTSVVIDLPGPAEITSDAEYLISTITVAELNVGIHTADSPAQRSERLARLQWVSDTFDPLAFSNQPAPAADQKPRRLHRPAPVPRPYRARSPTWVRQHGDAMRAGVGSGWRKPTEVLNKFLLEAGGAPTMYG